MKARILQMSARPATGEAARGADRASPRTRFAHLSATVAGVILLCLLSSIEYLLVRSGDAQSLPDASRVAETFEDAPLYMAVSGRVRRGEEYYGAAARELAERGYPVASVFNWRMPVYAWIFGLPAGMAWGRALLVAITVGASAAAGIVVGREAGRPMGIAAALGFAASYGWVFHREPAFYMEVWSGLFLFVSCSFFASGRPGWGVFSAAVALALRELALPFVAIASVGALRRRRWGPAGALGLVLAAFLAAFAMHSRCVALQGRRTVVPAFGHWVALGGGTFVLSASRMNYLLAMLPIWCAAFSLPLSVLGLIGVRGAGSPLPAVTAITYLIFFIFIGRDFNFYWGSMMTPLLVLGLFLSPRALRDLLAAALR